MGIIPDITVRKNLKDHLENNDPVLNATVDYLNKVKTRTTGK